MPVKPATVKPPRRAGGKGETVREWNAAHHGDNAAERTMAERGVRTLCRADLPVHWLASPLEVQQLLAVQKRIRGKGLPQNPNACQAINMILSALPGRRVDRNAEVARTGAGRWAPWATRIAASLARDLKSRSLDWSNGAWLGSPDSAELLSHQLVGTGVASMMAPIRGGGAGDPPEVRPFIGLRPLDLWFAWRSVAKNAFWMVPLSGSVLACERPEWVGAVPVVGLRSRIWIAVWPNGWQASDASISGGIDARHIAEARKRPVPKRELV